MSYNPMITKATICKKLKYVWIKAIHFLHWHDFMSMTIIRANMNTLKPNYQCQPLIYAFEYEKGMNFDNFAHFLK